MKSARAASLPGPAREAAHRILRRVSEDDAWASRLLESLVGEGLDERDIALAYEIVYGVLRWRGRLDRSLGALSSRPIETLDPPVREALRMGAYQILFLDRVPKHAAVNASVELARRTAPRGAEGLVNAVLRRLASKDPVPSRGAAGDDGREPDLAADVSHPAWLVERALKRYGLDQARAHLLANNEPPPLVLRPNPLHPSASRLADALLVQGVRVEAGRLAPGSLRVLSGRPAKTKLLSEGAFWIQDEASQVIPLLFPPPWRGLSADLCAAPGGKTFVLATGSGLPFVTSPGVPAEGSPSAGNALPIDRDDRPGRSAFSPEAEGEDRAHRVAAFDLHPHRLARMRPVASRIAPGKIAVVAADMASAPPLAPASFERVLVDAPCSGTGVLRRHPEIRWRLTLARVLDLASLQRRLLESAFTLVKPGGHIVYSVCSLEPEEGEDVLDGFVEKTGAVLLDPRPWLPESVRDAIDGRGRLSTTPLRYGSDGFFAAVVQKPRTIG